MEKNTLYLNKNHINTTVDNIKKDFINMMENNNINTIGINFYYGKDYDKELTQALFSVSTPYTICGKAQSSGIIVLDDKTDMLLGTVEYVEKTIRLEDNISSVNCEFIEMFDDFLKRNQIVTKIEWSVRKLNLDCCKRINQLLINNKQITKISFGSGPYIESYETIIQNVLLQELEIRISNIMELPKLLTMSSIQALKIKLSDETFCYEDKFNSEQLLNAFNNTNSLTSVNIYTEDCQRYGYGDLTIINNFIRCFCNSKNKTVKQLNMYLEDRAVYDKTIDADIKKFIAQNKHITKLSLLIPSVNNYDFLIENDTIEELCIRDCNYDSFAVKSIEKLILMNRKITDLTIEYALKEEDRKMLIEAIKINGTIEKLCVNREKDDYINALLNEVENIKKLKKQYVRTYLDLFAGYQIIPMINIINEYVGLKFTSPIQKVDT
ncbi:MAG: hypothetical protein Edafosvirus6_56 [Edafosvirus sp.]|uniref:Uncharacterized protein n=1 Tax=Edafosvirus sp. TaxID=2487765 RepID=A0A3G4ZTJ5_9VIRU|nr:MAG: hypothetical protein Edafosvirus6_56 [Edafosvirus sp.]